MITAARGLELRNLPWVDAGHLLVVHQHHINPAPGRLCQFMLSQVGCECAVEMIH
jgi:hypothetical protein